MLVLVWGMSRMGKERERGRIEKVRTGQERHGSAECEKSSTRPVGAGIRRRV